MSDVEDLGESFKFCTGEWRSIVSHDLLWKVILCKDFHQGLDCCTSCCCVDSSQDWKSAEVVCNQQVLFSGVVEKVNS